MDERHLLRAKLQGGDRRSIGRSAEVVAQVEANPALFSPLFDLLFYEDDVVRMRAADAVEEATRSRPEHLLPFKSRILDELSHSRQQEVRWHAAQLYVRLPLVAAEADQVLAILRDYLHDKSSIVRVAAMQALADLALRDRNLLPEVLPLLKTATETGTAAMRARGRKLLALLDDNR